MNEICVNISSYDGRDSMSVILKRPSILTLATLGKIPNPLLSAAAKLFEFAPKSEPASIKEIGEILHIVAEASLINPSYEEVRDQLTDTQLMEIYHYAKGGADGLEYFRVIRELHKDSIGGKSKQQPSERNAED